MKPQRLLPKRGLEWFKAGYALFMKSPLLMVVMVMICILTVLGLSAVPLVGEPLASLLLPVLLVGLMTGCQALAKGEELELAHLFNGFQQRTSQLVTLGGIALVGQFMIFGAMIAVGGATLVSIIMSGQPVENPEIIKQAVTGAGMAILLGLTLFTTLMMAMQFAPMLVFFNNLAPLEAMKQSLRAFVDNIGAMMVYSTVFLFLAILASIPMFLGWVLLLPLVFTSMYACYCDIFPAGEEAQPAIPGDVFTPDKDIFKP